jgi:ornithine--oxo-acid transaminase
MIENSQARGEQFRQGLKAILSPSILEVRGKGLLNAIEINDTPDSETAWNICLEFAKNGLLAKPTHGNIIRLAPPLVINEKQIIESLEIIKNSLAKF